MAACILLFLMQSGEFCLDINTKFIRRKSDNPDPELIWTSYDFSNKGCFSQIKISQIKNVFQ